MPEEFEEQHPIPQQISSYQFKLVGDMTLKQFLEVAGGAMVALLFYASPLHPAIKWPLILISFLFGVALAFLPLEDRSLGTWIIIFFRSIYSPTMFIWKKSAQPRLFFQPEGTEVSAEKKEEVTEPQILVTTPAPPTDQAKQQQQTAMIKLEQKEQNFLSKISQLFNLSTLLGKPTATPAQQPATAYVHQPSVTPTPKATIISAQTVAPQATSAAKSRHPAKIPEPVTITVDSQKDTSGKKADTPVSVSQQELEHVIRPVTPLPAQKASISAKHAKFSADAAPPIPPTQANVVVGQVLDSEGKIIDGAILEIKDEASRPIRALKTNKLGHFMIVTPLMEGRYQILAEKEGFEFEPVTFWAEAKIIPPIALWANKKVAEEKQS